ncbi:MAG: hypothetical protein J2P17_33695 [Mycobacterium sp.]|nr:hypothetical protein [Mycobacterium sp.]
MSYFLRCLVPVRDDRLASVLGTNSSLCTPVRQARTTFAGQNRGSAGKAAPRTAYADQTKAMLLSTPAPIALVDMPPERPAGIGRLTFYVDGSRAGEVYVQVCEPCRLGVVHGLRAGIEHRRDLAMLAITTLLDRHPNHSWTTTPTPHHPAGGDMHGLWAAIGLPAEDTPRTCLHMQIAHPAAAPDTDTDETEFVEVLRLLRASPRADELSDEALERRARAAWQKFEQAPVRSFVPLLVEREVLRNLPARRAADD